MSKQRSRRNRSITKSQTPEYTAWRGMIRRCYDATSSLYFRYGGRGIYVCTRWLESFDDFLADMGRRPTDKHSLDRIDNDGGYTPDNCRWATQYEQQWNTSRNVRFTHDGKTLCLSQWARETGIPFTTLANRLRMGIEFSKAISMENGRGKVRAMIRNHVKSHSGCIGVSVHKATGKWRARILDRHLGLFESLEDAVAARKHAEQSIYTDGRR